MTATAISSLLAGASRAASRPDKAGSPDADGTPFARLLGSEPDDAPAAEAAPAAREDTADSPAAGEATVVAEAGPQLPAWLLALRAPPPPTGEGATANAVPAAASAPKGGSLPPAAPLTLDSLRNAKGIVGRPGETPPTRTPPTGIADGREAVAALAADAAAPPVTAALPGADTTLDAARSAALDAAIARLDTLLAASASTPTQPAADRGTPVPAGSAAIGDTAAALAAASTGSLAVRTDTYGEPLSLEGRDAAIRLGERLRWLHESGVQEARLQLHPRELGSVDIRIRIEGQAASVWFGADHPGARAALEAALPQLRERLAGEGLQLGQTSVGSQGNGGGGQPWQQAGEQTREPPEPVAGGRRGDADDGEAARPSLVPASGSRLVRGLVDRYA